MHRIYVSTVVRFDPEGNIMTAFRLNEIPPFGVLEQAFLGVTPSFHLLNNQFYETIFSSFQSILYLASRLTFSVRNVSPPPSDLK